MTINNNKKANVKWSRYRPGVAQRVGRGIALLFHDRCTRRGWVLSSTPRPHFTPGKDPIPILQVAGWASVPVLTGGKSRPHRDSIPDRTARRLVAIPTELPGPLNPFNAELNPICHFLALLGAHLILHISRIRVNNSKTFFKITGCESNELTWLRAWPSLGCCECYSESTPCIRMGNLSPGWMIVTFRTTLPHGASYTVKCLIEWLVSLHARSSVVF